MRGLARNYDARSRYRGEVASDYNRARMAGRQWRRETDAIEKHLRASRGQVVLDVPFGTGRFAPIYLDRGVGVIGVDVSADMLAEAGRDSAVKELAASLVEGDVEKLPLADGSVDYIVSTRLLNWLPSDVRETALGEFHRVGRLGLLVQVRVREVYSRAGFVTRLARSGILNAPDIGRGLLKGVRSAGDRRRDESAEPNAGYTTPDAVEFERLLVGSGFEVRAKERVHEDVHVRARTIYCKTLYACARAASPSAAAADE